jgi:hypothetical protein
MIERVYYATYYAAATAGVPAFGQMQAFQELANPPVAVAAAEYIVLFLSASEDQFFHVGIGVLGMYFQPAPVGQYPVSYARPDTAAGPKTAPKGEIQVVCQVVWVYNQGERHKAWPRWDRMGVSDARMGRMGGFHEGSVSVE